MYVLKCSDGSLYCGVTTDLDRRYREHSLGSGAKYTRSRRPVSIVYSEKHENRSQAQVAESSFKKLTRKEKEEYIRYEKNKARRFSDCK